jgi:hypothetical protein
VSLQYDPILVRCLASELGAILPGRRARELRLDRRLRAAELRLQPGPALLFLLHPEAGFVLEAAPGSLDLLALRAESRGGPAVEAGPAAVTVIPLRRRIGAVWSPPDERLLVLELEGAGSGGRLVAELLTNQWNLLTLEGGATRPGTAAVDAEVEPDWGRITAAMWPREAGRRSLRGGGTYRPPAFPGGPRRWRSEPPSPEAWHALLADVEPGRRAAVLLHEAAWSSPLNVAWLLGGAGGDDASRTAGPGDELDAALERYRTLLRLAGVTAPAGRAGLEAPLPRAAPAGPAEAWLLPGAPAAQPYPLPLGLSDARRARSLLEAFALCARASGRWAPPPVSGETEGGTSGAGGAAPPPAVAPNAEALELETVLRSGIRRAERRIASLERELTGGPDAARLREDANLLLARLGDVPRGSSRITLEDFAGERRELELDPRLSAAENAERLYQKAASRERAASRLPAAIDRARSRVLELREGLSALAESGPSEEVWTLAGGRPDRGAAGSPRAGGSRLPYRRYRSTGGLEIRVGRGARENDALTFRHSHTEDIWLHARQVPGAHVILRWGKRDENPPRQDLMEAALAAAVHSDARHSGTVAVDWTRRKYVRSPRKAPPGTVIPERVQTIFVEPNRALLDRLRVTGGEG